MKAKQNGEMSIIDALFPIKTFFSAKNLNIQVVSILIVYFWVTLLQPLVMHISYSSNYIYITFFILLSVTELFLLSRICYILKINRKLIYIGFSVLAFAILSSSILTIYFQQFQILNVCDFILLVAKLIISIILFGRIIISGMIEDLMSIFLIISGFTLFFILNMFSTGFLLNSFVGNYDISVVFMAIVFSFWLGGSIWLRKGL